MTSLAAVLRHRQGVLQWHIVVAAWLGVAWMAGPAARADDIVGAPIDLSAFVHEGLLPGGIIFEDAHQVLGAATTPKQSAEYLHLASKGLNLSGHSTDIAGAFASALSESDGNGGVGVTAWIGGNPSNTNPDSIGQQVARATWVQNFTYNGTVPVSISLHLHIPSLVVGLIGVPPDRSGFSDTETAEAKAELVASITHADLTTSPGASFEFGLHALEKQLIGPGGVFPNFADVQFLGANDSTASLFDSFKDNGSASNPRFSVDSVSTNIRLGTLQPGDTVSYIYQLTAQGTTHGGEQGYMAFLGDPFGVDITPGNLVLSTAPLPEPGTSMLTVVGLTCIGPVFGRRRGKRDRSTAFSASQR